MIERVKTRGGPASPIETYLSDEIQYRPDVAADRAYRMADAMLAHKEATDPEPYDISKEWAR